MFGFGRKTNQPRKSPDSTVAEAKFHAEKGFTEWQSGRLFDARSSLHTSLGLFESVAGHDVVGLLNGWATVLLNLHGLYRDLNDPRSGEALVACAETYLRYAEAAPPGSNDKAEGYAVIGKFFDSADRMQLAEGLLRQARALNELQRRPDREAACWFHVGWACEQQGKLEEAEEAYLKALHLNEVLGRTQMIPKCKEAINRVRKMRIRE